MLRNLLLLSLCVPVGYASGNTNTPSPNTPKQKTRIVKVRMLPADGSLERCVNQRIHERERVDRHDEIVQGHRGRITTDSLSMIEAEIGRLWTQKDVWDGTLVQQSQVYRLINLARALESCSRTYEIEIPVDASAEDLEDRFSVGRYIAVLKPDGSGSNIYVVESLRPE